MTPQQAHDFAEAIREMATGMKFTHYDPFYVSAFNKCADVIDELSTTAECKEKEGKGETFPPTPPIESKGKEEKATTTTTARAHARDFPPPKPNGPTSPPR